MRGKAIARDVGLALCCWLGLWILPAEAQQPFLGTWTIAKADVAPWAQTPLRDDTDVKDLVGKTVIFQKGRIEGPHAIRCPKPHFEMKTYTPEMLFQGAFDQDQEAGKKAERLGFSGNAIAVLETGCGNELDYHFVNDDTMLIGLNDHIYTLARKKR